MLPTLFDSHSHLDAAQFDADRGAVILRAHAAGVQQQLLPAVTFVSWASLQSTCKQTTGLYAAYGLHPMFLNQHQPEHLDALADWIAREQPKAIGECGLDFFIEGLDAELQRFYFHRQLELAREFDLPVVIHARRAVEEVIATLRKIGGLRGVIHSYSGSEEQARQLFELGFYLGIGGSITYERAQRLRRLVATMPLDFLLLETDSPDQPDAQHRGQRNEPAYLTEVLRVVAATRQQPEEEIALATTANAQRLFAIPAEQSPE